MEELIFFFKGLLSLAGMAIWLVIGIICATWIDVIVGKILGIDRTEENRYYLSNFLKGLMSLLMYSGIIDGIREKKEGK
jgi:Na+/citrate or Na+/malate symporter